MGMYPIFNLISEMVIEIPNLYCVNNRQLYKPNQWYAFFVSPIEIVITFLFKEHQNKLFKHHGQPQTS